jgi:hypothetical protein
LALQKAANALTDYANTAGRLDDLLAEQVDRYLVQVLLDLWETWSVCRALTTRPYLASGRRQRAVERAGQRDRQLH